MIANECQLLPSSPALLVKRKSAPLSSEMKSSVVLLACSRCGYAKLSGEGVQDLHQSRTLSSMDDGR